MQRLGSRPTYTTRLLFPLRVFAFVQVGSMAIFDSWGVRHPVTVLQLDECEVVQVKAIAQCQSDFFFFLD